MAYRVARSGLRPLHAVGATSSSVANWSAQCSGLDRHPSSSANWTQGSGDESSWRACRLRALQGRLGDRDSWTRRARRPLRVRAESRPRMARLVAEKESGISIPLLLDNRGTQQPLAAFFQHPIGRESLLNTNALQKMEKLDANLFRCHLPSVEWLSFRVAPVVDLRVVSSEEECLVELLSCKFEGSQALEEQNKRFSASMRNYVTWRTQPSGEQLLQATVSMNVALEVFTLPFTLLPLSAVEVPGNGMLQAMLERLVPLFLDHLIDDYRQWVQMVDEGRGSPHDSGSRGESGRGSTAADYSGSDAPEEDMMELPLGQMQELAPRESGRIEVERKQLTP